MDSQLFSNFFAGLSALAAIISAICAFIAWYQSIGSKKAKAEAEERARQAEELLAQMSDIASSLRRLSWSWFMKTRTTLIMNATDCVITLGTLSRFLR